MTGPHTNIDNHGFLSDASMEALELQHQPFAETPVGGELFEDDTTRSVIADINDALYGSDDVLMIIGTAGSGRSILLRQLANNPQSRIACFSVKGSPRFDTAHLFGSVLEAFKTPVPADLKDALDALVPSLQGTFERYNRLSTIVLDDADQVPVDELTKLLSSVLYLNGQEEPLLRVLLSSTPEFEERLPDALPQGAEIQYASLVLDPMTSDRAEKYLEFRFNQAGYFDNSPFTDRDMQSIVEESAGYPRSLNSAAALNLNAQHGQMPESMLPPELVEHRGNGTMVKMLLGGLACLMIVAGLFMFTQNKGERSPASRASNDYRTVETVPVNPKPSAPTTELEIMAEAPEAPTASDTAAAATAADVETEANAVLDQISDTADADETDEANIVANQPSIQPPAQPAESTPAKTETPVPVEVASADTTEAAPADNSDDALLAGASGTPTPASTLTSNPAPSNEAPAAPDSTTSTTTEESQAEAQSSVLESPTWILVQDPDRFTVQMSASTDRDSVENFMTRNNLPGPNSIFSFNRNGATWYALVHGLFRNVPEARTALKALPEGALRNQPWIRRIGQVQSSLKEQN